MFDILSTRQVPTIVPELKNWWTPQKIEDFLYMSPNMLRLYLKALNRRVTYYKCRIYKDPSMQKDWLAISQLINDLSKMSSLNENKIHLADELVCPVHYAKDDYVVAFDNPQEQPDSLTHTGPLYVGKVLMAKIDLSMMLVGPTDNSFPPNERGRVPTVLAPHRLSQSWAMHYNTFSYYYTRRQVIDDHLQLFDPTDVSQQTRVDKLIALKTYFEGMTLK